MLIDIHVHTSKIAGVTRPNGSRYLTPAELVAMLDASGIDRAVMKG